MSFFKPAKQANIVNPAKQGDTITNSTNASNVTAVVCTRGRHETTLPLCLAAIGMQSRPVSGIWIYDDNDTHVDLREVEPYKQLFTMLMQKGIQYQVTFGNGTGQVRGHKLSLRECKTEYIWRVDDDDIPEPTCLEKLMLRMEAYSNCGACGGLVIDVGNQTTSDVASNKIEDIYLGLNEQWFRNPNAKTHEVDHLYSSFVYKRGEDYYPSNLSRVGHREETIFTYRMKRAGMKVLLVPEAITWHLKSKSGGIRDGYQEMWHKDEDVFAELLRDWGVNTSDKKVITLDNGLGDHYAFKTILPDILARYPNLVLACCYPDVFRAYKDIKIISIAAAYAGDHREGIYKWLFEHNWKGSLTDAYRACYLG